MTNSLTLYHAPNSRSSAVWLLLEELGAPFELHVLNFKKGEQRGEAYRAINPMGKVPAVRHGDALITEQVAIFLYLADLFPEKGLAPAIGDPLRGPYLRWMVYYAACMEPAIVDRALKREPAPPGISPYGEYDTVMNTLIAQISKGPFFLGERFTAADILWGSALMSMLGWKLLPDDPVLKDYVARFGELPAVAKIKARDAEIHAAQEEPAK